MAREKGRVGLKLTSGSSNGLLFVVIKSEELFINKVTKGSDPCSGFGNSDVASG